MILQPILSPSMEDPIVKQTLKINFLTQENRQLQEEINDLTQILRLNKEAMNILLEKNEKNDKNDLTLDSGFEKSDETANLSPNNLKTLKQALEKLHKELSFLELENKKLRKERNEAQCRSLVCEQICEENENHEKIMAREYDERIIGLKNSIQDKEYTIQEMEKTGGLRMREEGAVRCVEVLGLNEQVLKLLEEKQVLKLNLEFSLKETDLLKDKLRKAEERIESLSVFLNCYFYILNNPINLQTLRSLKNEGCVSEQLFEFFPKKQVPISKPEGPITNQSPNLFNTNDLKSKNKINQLYISQDYFLREIKTLKKEIEILTNNNNLLTKTFKIKDQKIELLQIENEIHKSYFRNYMQFLKVTNKRLFPKKYADFRTKNLFSFIIEEKELTNNILEDVDKIVDFSREKAIQYLKILSKDLNKTLNYIFWMNYNSKNIRDPASHLQNNLKKRSLSLPLEYISKDFWNEIKNSMENGNKTKAEIMTKNELKERIRKNSDLQANLTFISEWETKNEKVENNSPWREEISYIGNAKEVSFMDKVSFFINLKKN